MATKENDWKVFLAGLGYNEGNNKHKPVFAKFKETMTTPGELASLWAELGSDVALQRREAWLKEQGIGGDSLSKILSGIGVLAPKDKDKTGDKDIFADNVANKVVEKQSAAQPDKKRKDGDSSTIEKGFSKNVLARDGNVCLVTGVKDNLNAAHIVPKKFRGTLAGTKLSINDTYMGLTMSHEVHQRFDRYEFCIDPQTCKVVVSQTNPPPAELIKAGLELTDGNSQPYSKLIGTLPCYPTTKILELRQKLFQTHEQSQSTKGKKRDIEEESGDKIDADILKMNVPELREQCDHYNVEYSEKKDRKARLQILLMTARRKSAGAKKVVKKPKTK